MRRCVTIIATTIICVIPLCASAQIGGSEPLIKYAESQASKVFEYNSDETAQLWSFSEALDFLGDNNGIEAGSLLGIKLRTWSVPITLVRLDFNESGNSFIAPALSVGIGYAWISGVTIIDATSESLRIEPQTSIGIATSFGAVNGVDGITVSITVSGVIGFNSLNMSLGYDLITETAVLGVGFRIDVFSLSRNSYRISKLSG